MMKPEHAIGPGSFAVPRATRALFVFWGGLFALHCAFPRSALAEKWHEVRSPHFVVLSDAGEKKAREVAREFEEIREVFRTALTSANADPSMPIVIFAVKNENGLKELLPQYWERDGARPGGVFQRAQDKYFIALRTDLNRRPQSRSDRFAQPKDRWTARWNNPYRTIYHEYFHLLTSLNLRRVPVWLREGLAQFWAETVIRDNRVELGNPNWHHLEYLQQRPHLPLRDLLGASQNPHEPDPNRVATFYAQAWALTHWLMLGDETGSGREALDKYRELVAGGENSVAAFERVLGSLEAVEIQLRLYVRQPHQRAMRMDMPVKVDEKSFSLRELTDAESKAARGNFLVSGPRADHALSLLQEALTLDTESSLAMESMGFYHYSKGERQRAEEWFNKAARAGSQSFMCHFYRAILAKERGERAAPVVEEGLLRAIELNPQFARAHAELGALYARRGEKREAAFSLATRAVELDPDSAWLWVNLGYILLRLDLANQAREAEQSAIGVAQTSHDTAAIKGLSEQIARYEGGARRQIQVRGVFRELRCLPGNRFEFVLATEDVAYVLQTSSPEFITFLENGETIEKGLACGSQQAEVVATYVPTGGSAGAGEVQGELKILDFLTLR